MPYNLVVNEKDQQYEFHVAGSVAKIEFNRKENKIYLIHTEVPQELGGKGIASALVKAVLEDIEKKNLTLIPKCPFVAGYLERHPEWKRLT